MPSKLEVKVVPGAAATRVVGWLGSALKLQTAAAPEKGKANSAIIDLLAKELGIRKGDVRIASGHTSANKVVEFLKLSDDELEERLSRFKE